MMILFIDLNFTVMTGTTTKVDISSLKRQEWSMLLPLLLGFLSTLCIPHVTGSITLPSNCWFTLSPLFCIASASTMTSSNIWDQSYNIPLLNFFICHQNILVTPGTVDITYYKAFREWSDLPKVITNIWCLPLLLYSRYCFLRFLVCFAFVLEISKEHVRWYEMRYWLKNRVCHAHLIPERLLFSLSRVPCSFPLIPNLQVPYGMAYVFKKTSEMIATSIAVWCSWISVYV